MEGIEENERSEGKIEGIRLDFEMNWNICMITMELDKFEEIKGIERNMMVFGKWSK